MLYTLMHSKYAQLIKSKARGACGLARLLVTHMPRRLSVYKTRPSCQLQCHKHWAMAAQVFWYEFAASARVRASSYALSGSVRACEADLPVPQPLHQLLQSLNSVQLGRPRVDCRGGLSFCKDLNQCFRTSW